MEQKVFAKLNYLHIAPRKVRLIGYPLKNLSVNEAEAQLMFRPQRSSKPLLKLLRSAIANAKNNFKLNPDKLIIKEIRVDQGPIIKRSLPRAMGRTTPIHKKMSHVTIVLEEKQGVNMPRFNIEIVKNKKVGKKSGQKEKMKKIKSTVSKQEINKSKEKAGFFRRFFRRKTV